MLRIFCLVVVFFTSLTQAKRQLRRLFWRQFWATAQLRTVFGTSCSFLTIRVNLKQNNSCTVLFRANFEQHHICTDCFAQVLSKTANQSSLDIIYLTHQFRYIYSCALFFAQFSGQTVRIFYDNVVFLTFLTKDANFYLFVVVDTVLH